MALPNLVVAAVAEWNGKALTKGASQINKFDKTVKNLGRTLGVTFSAAALLAYSKKSVAAYGEQIAETKRLDQALRNLGYSFATAEAEGYIDSLERATGVNRDQLQPAFIQLAQVTRSTTIAQSMLNTAMDISAGTGMDLTSSTKILSQAYVGNLKGLRQLNLGLTQAELASKSYLEIEKLIAAQYAGQSALAADSYAGSVGRLKIAAEQASEQIGQSLVSALSISSGGFDKLIGKVDSASDSISGMITNTSFLIAQLNKIPGAGVFNNVLDSITGYLGKFSIGNIRKLVDQIQGNMGGFPQGVPQDLKNLQTNIEKAKMDKEALKRQKELIALQKKSLLAEKNKLALTKAAAFFDSNRISIAAALKATTDKETRLRLEALMAIEDEDGATALKRISEIAALQKNADAEKLAAGKNLITEKTEAELSAIDRVAKAQALSDAARLASLKLYIQTLGSIAAPTFGGSTNLGTTITQGTVAAAIADRSGYDISGPSDPRVLYGGQRLNMGGGYDSFNPEMLGMTSGGSSTNNFTVNVNTGIGDPNAIAEAIDQVLIDAVQRGTLRGGMLAI
jgi:hypothetical protein